MLSEQLERAQDVGIMLSEELERAKDWLVSHVPRAVSHETLLGHLRQPLMFTDELISWYPRVRPYTRRELAADAIVHALGLVFGAVGLVLMGTRFVFWPPQWVTLSVGVYSFSLFGMLVCSAAFNVGQRVKGWDSEHLALLDHIGICLLIAGSHIPILARACCLRALLAIWILMLLTIVAKWSRGWFDHIALHVVAFVFGPLINIIVVHDRVSTALEPWELHSLYVAGAFYIGGLLPWSFRQLEFHVAIWHVCVLTASGCIFTMVFVSVSSLAKVAALERDLATCATTGELWPR